MSPINLNSFIFNLLLHIILPQPLPVKGLEDCGYLVDKNNFTLPVYIKPIDGSRSIDNYIVKNESELTIRKADFRFNMINLEGQHFFETLRNKLLWGIDKRQ